MALRSKAKAEQPQEKAPIVNSPGDEIVLHALAHKLPQPILASDETVARERSLLSEAMIKQYESKTSCFLQAMDDALSESSLSVDEQLVSERFTYLEMAFNWIPKYTPVFVRRTNLAEFCICFPGYIIKPSQVRQETSCEDLLCYEEPQAPQLGSGGPYSAITDIAKDLAKGLLSGIAGKLGALIFDKIFPPGIPDYFGAVYSEIKKIVHQELTQSAIDEINGEINGIQTWVKITYGNDKKSGTLTKKQLTDLLEPRETQLVTETLGPLMTERYAQPGICTFMIGAGMHLSVLQELAFVDPNVSKPPDSPYVKSIKDYAKTYADFAKTTTQSIIHQRLAMIEPKSKVLNIYNPNTFRYTYWYMYWWEDKYNGKMSQTFASMYPSRDEIEKRDKSMAKHKNDAQEELIKSMQDPEETANLWLKLVDQPLPSQ